MTARGGERREAGRVRYCDEGWSITIDGDEAAAEPWAATILALSNGAIGVRGALDEHGDPGGTTFLAHAYEQSPIAYHERFTGFAESTDTRVPVAELLPVAIRIDGAALTDGTLVGAERTLDVRAGLLRARSHWRLADGTGVTVGAERLVPIDGRLGHARRIVVTPDRDATVELRATASPAPRPPGQGDDPRIGAALSRHGFDTVVLEPARVVERLRGSGIGVAAAQRVGRTDDLVAAGRAGPEAPLTVELFAAYAVSDEDDAALARTADELADTLARAGFARLAADQAEGLAAFWRDADIVIEGDPATQAALRLNLFHLYQSSGRDGRSSAAAKGLTGQGYEGHYFWDAEVFMLPVLAVTAPAVARSMLKYRYGTLDAARANARALNHDRGALYAWRTIAGRECSGHYPSGSAAYHINADIAYAIGLYVQATGDEAILAEAGAEMLVETARLWLTLGAHEEDGGFAIRGVTGPDEYTALVDNNWYTNRMAQRHLRLAAEAAPMLSPDAAARIGFDPAETADWRRAADAMRLPYDAGRDLDAQDDSFLDKPRWDLAGTPADRFPLLLHYHPMTLYRRQVAKQADLVLGLVLAGEDVPLDRKRRDFDHYESVTSHDSTLSACSFSILASEVGRTEAAWRHFRETCFVDLDDLHGNSGHGVHMAAMAGSWLALVWGFAGFRPDAVPRFRPTLPAAWRGYAFRMRWRGARLRVAVSVDEVMYTVEAEGGGLALRHRDETLVLAPGESVRRPA